MDVNEVKQNAEEKVAALKAIDWPKIGKYAAIIGGAALGVTGVVFLVKQGGIDTVKEAIKPVTESASDAAKVAKDVAESVA